MSRGGRARPDRADPRLCTIAPMSSATVPPAEGAAGKGDVAPEAGLSPPTGRGAAGTAGDRHAVEAVEPEGARRAWAVPDELLEPLLRRPSRRMLAFHRLFWSGIWLVFTGYPISDVLTRHWPPAKVGLAWAALVLFDALYLLTLWMASDFGTARPRGMRMAPYVAFVALTVAMAMGFGGNFPGLLIFAGVATGWTLPQRAGVVALGVLAALDFLTLTVGVDLGSVLFFAFLTVALGFSMMFFLAVVRLNVELQAAREEVARLAAAEARLRFSRDLHDVLGHSLSVIALQSQVARRLLHRDPGAAERALGELETVTRDSLAAVREMASGYRQPTLSEELQHAREVLGAAGVRVEVAREGPEPSPRSGALLAWAVREGVTNVLRHSRARSCRIAVTADAGGLRLELNDDGIGSAVASERGRGAGSGLRGLRERMAAAGGMVEAGPRAAGGFRLAVRLPAP